MGKCLASSPCFQNRNLSLRNHPTVGPEAILGHLLSNGKLGVVSFETAKEHLISPLSGTCPQRKLEQCQGDQNAGVRISLCLYFWVLFLLIVPFSALLFMTSVKVFITPHLEYSSLPAVSFSPTCSLRLLSCLLGYDLSGVSMQTSVKMLCITSHKSQNPLIHKCTPLEEVTGMQFLLESDYTGIKSGAFAREKNRARWMFEGNNVLKQCVCVCLLK